MSNSPRFIMIGGFLGAGKTTTIAKLAARYQAEGKRVAIVTNDQATDLVDTLLLRSQGFDVGEVAGSCFCCNFNALTDAVESLSVDQRPDVVLAEPVGSCTDLVATVLRPLEQIYNQPFDIAPYAAIIKPSHGFKILAGGGQGGFSPKAEYIFRKQLEEADLIILNRIDELSAEQIDSMVQLLSREYPDTPLTCMSAKTEEGFDSLCDQLERSGFTGGRSMEVDYDIYAEGEAELGWLNCQVAVESDESFELDSFLLQLLQRLQQTLLVIEAEVAHLKAIGMADGAYSVVNLVSNSGEAVLSLPSGWQGRQADLVVNARVALDPAQLDSVVREAVDRQARQSAATARITALQCFRPGRPVPTHRLSS